MKSTVKVSISGIVFHLDTDAYSGLKNYLDRIERRFAGKEGGREVIDDIEVRMAELFSARIQAPAQVITLAMVDEVIAVVGSADDIAGDESDAGAPEQEPVRAPEAEGKRLFRDIDHRMIGGVCSGLGNYFDIDRVLIRLALAVAACFSVFWLHGSFLFFAGVVYVALWVVMPAARTMKEKMAMRKEPIAPPSFSRRDGEGAHRAAHRNDIGQVVGQVITVVCRVVAGIALAVVAMVALTFIVALPFGFFNGNMIVDGVNIAEYVQYYTTLPLWLLALLLTLLVCLPLVGVMYLLSKVLFRFKTKIRMGLILAVVWLSAFFALAGVAIYVASVHRDGAPEPFSGSAPFSVTEERPVDSFGSLRVAGNFEVTAFAADTNYLVIRTTKRMMSHLRIENDGGRLKIESNKRHGLWEGTTCIDIYCSDWSRLENVYLSGTARLTAADTLRGDSFSARLSGAGALALVLNNRRAEVAASGASKIDVAGYVGEFAVDASGASNITADMTAEKVRLDLSGASRVTLSGASAHADFKLSGASKTDAAHFTVDTMYVRLSGSGKMAIDVVRYLNVNASGASKIEYTGHPVTDINTNGAAKVRRIPSTD